MAETITLKYVAPVYVEVNVEERRVVAVECADEEVTFERAGGEPATVERALRIAEDADWPEWTFG